MPQDVHHAGIPDINRIGALLADSPDEFGKKAREELVAGVA